MLLFHEVASFDSYLMCHNDYFVGLTNSQDISPRLMSAEVPFLLWNGDFIRRCTFKEHCCHLSFQTVSKNTERDIDPPNIFEGWSYVKPFNLKSSELYIPASVTPKVDNWGGAQWPLR